MGRLSLTYLDASGERSNVSIRTTDLTSVNFDAEQTESDAIRDAIAGVSLLTQIKDTRVAVETEAAAVKPADQFAQRETKWLVRFTDNVNGKSGTFEIPGADLDLLVTGQGEMDIEAGAGLALVNALETGMLSRDGNAITVSEVVHVGRNI